MILFLKATPGQHKAGNYRMKRLRWRGMDISIENRKGSARSGVDPSGQAWRVVMVADYGYIRMTLGTDGDHLDCFVGPDKGSDKVYVIEGMRAGKWTEFDEDKAMIGFASKRAAESAFLASYSDRRFMGKVKTMTADEFKQAAMRTRSLPKGQRRL